jgi:hypothetical protein
VKGLRNWRGGGFAVLAEADVKGDEAVDKVVWQAIEAEARVMSKVVRQLVSIEVCGR